MRQNNNAKHGENDDKVQRQVDLYGGLSAHAGRSKDPALVDAINRTIVFWKRYFTLLPWIASLARKVLSSVATIAAAERVFRGAGLIVPAKLYNAKFYVGPTPKSLISLIKLNNNKLNKLNKA